jgi:hypothetical protein
LQENIRTNFTNWQWTEACRVHHRSTKGNAGRAHAERLLDVGVPGTCISGASTLHLGSLGPRWIAAFSGVYDVLEERI